LLGEIAKLEAVRELQLPENLFGDKSDRLVAAWRSRAARMFPSDFLDCPEPVRYTLLAPLCWMRQAEIIDALIGLLVDLVQKINARAERRVEKELMGDLPTVPGKKGIFVKMVKAVHAPGRAGPHRGMDGGARRREDPAPTAERADGEQPGGPGTSPLSVAWVMFAPLSADARAGAGCADVPVQQHTYRPVMDAIELLARYAKADAGTEQTTPKKARATVYAEDDVVPIEGVVPKEWQDAITDEKAALSASPTSCAC
jgi:hypothetical protein